MSSKQKLVLVSAVVALLVATAVYFTAGYLSGGGAEVTASPAWQNLTPDEREKKLDDEERRRRKSGRGAMRRLPEDPAGGPPKRTPAGASR